MSQGPTCRAPAVSWSDLEDREYWRDPEDHEYSTDPDMIAQEVNRLVHDLWWRLPEVMRTVIACGLGSIKLRTSEEALPPSFEDREIRIYLNEEMMDRAWKAEVSGALAWGFGMAFLEALSVQVPWEDSRTRPVIAGARGRQRARRSDASPSLTQMIRSHDRKANAYISQMAEALALAWGFEEAIAAIRSREESGRLSEGEECSRDEDPERYSFAQAFFPRKRRIES